MIAGLRTHVAFALNAFRVARLRASGVYIAMDARVAASVEIGPGSNSTAKVDVIVGSACQFSRGTIVHTFGGRIEFGRNVFIGPYTVVYGHGGVTIGDDTLISMHCRILSSNHTVPLPGISIRSQPDVPLPTRIGRDVWLGAGVTVLGGVTIADGCVVGAGAVVTHDLPPNSIALGVPARVTGRRAMGA